MTLALGCGSGASDLQGNFRFFNGVPLIDAVDIFINEDLEVGALPFGQSTEYSTFDEGETRIRINEADQFALLVDVRRDLNGDFDHTIIVHDVPSDARLLVLRDDNSEPESGRAKLRIVNVADAQGSLDVYVTSTNDPIDSLTPAVENLGINSASTYLQSRPGTYRIKITKGNRNVVLATSDPITFAEGEIRTAVITDSSGGDFPPRIVMMQDRLP